MGFHQIFSKIYKDAAQRMCLDCEEFINKGDRILDFGCGSGIIAKTFEQHFNSEVVGVDIKDSRTIDIPFKLIKNNKIDFNNLNFDVILISYVLHHTKDPEVILREIKRIGKRIIIYEDLPEGFFSKITCLFHEMSYKLLFQRVDYRFSFKTEKEWKELFNKIGLKTVAFKKPKSKFYFLYPVKRILFILE